MPRANLEIENTLHQLTLEILEFGEIIQATADHGNDDFLIACDLFSGYLREQLENINSSTRWCNSSPNMMLITAQLCELGALIKPQITRAEQSQVTPWANRLLNFCNGLKSLRDMAA